LINHPQPLNPKIKPKFVLLWSLNCCHFAENGYEESAETENVKVSEGEWTTSKNGV
jgi:hypothetical protein